MSLPSSPLNLFIPTLSVCFERQDVEDSTESGQGVIGAIKRMQPSRTKKFVVRLLKWVPGKTTDSVMNSIDSVCQMWKYHEKILTHGCLKLFLLFQIVSRLSQIKMIVSDISASFKAGDNHFSKIESKGKFNCLAGDITFHNAPSNNENYGSSCLKGASIFNNRIMPRVRY